MAVRKPVTKRGRPSKVDKANENLAKLALEQASCSCQDHEDHSNCNNECDCFDGESEPQVRGTMPFTIPLSKVMEQQVGNEEAEKKKVAVTLRQKYNEAKSKGRIREDGLIQMDIFRLPLFSIDGAIGPVADKEFIFRTYVSVEYGENEDYFILLQRYGPGAYKIYFRDMKGIMATYEKHIGKSTPTQVDPATGQPAINITMPNGNAQQPIGVMDPLKMVRDYTNTMMQDQLTMLGEMRKQMIQSQFKQMTETPPTTPPPAPAFDPNAFLAQVIQTKEVASALVQGLTGKQREGKKDLVELMFEHLPSIIREGKEAAKELIQEYREGKQNAQTQNQRPAPRRIQPRSQVAPHQNQPQTGDGAAEGGQSGSEEQATAEALIEMGATIEDQALIMLLLQFKRRVPPQVAFGRLTEFDDELPPGSSIWPYYELLAEVTPAIAIAVTRENLTDVVLHFVPDAKELLESQSAQGWIAGLQGAIRKHLAEIKEREEEEES
jgi:hypothetical protein